MTENPCRPRRTVPENSSSSGISPSARAWKYLRRRHLEVVGAGDRQVDLGDPGERGHGVDTWVHENGRSESAHCGGSPKSSTSAASPRRRIGGVGARCGTWQRRAMAWTGAAAALGDAQPQRDRRHGRVRLGAGVEDNELEVAHTTLSRARRRRTRRAPRGPRGRRRSRATASAAGRPARSRRRSGRGSTRRPRASRSARTRNASTSGASVASSGWPSRARPRCRGAGATRSRPQARVERGHPLDARVDEEERDAHGDLQRVPLRARQPEVGERDVPLRAPPGSDRRPRPSGAKSSQQSRHAHMRLRRSRSTRWLWSSPTGSRQSSQVSPTWGRGGEGIRRRRRTTARGSPLIAPRPRWDSSRSAAAACGRGSPGCR